MQSTHDSNVDVPALAQAWLDSVLEAAGGQQLGEVRDDARREGYEIRRNGGGEDNQCNGRIEPLGRLLLWLVYARVDLVMKQSGPARVRCGTHQVAAYLEQLRLELPHDFVRLFRDPGLRGVVKPVAVARLLPDRRDDRVEHGRDLLEVGCALALRNYDRGGPERCGWERRSRATFRDPDSELRVLLE